MDTLADTAVKKVTPETTPAASPEHSESPAHPPEAVAAPASVPRKSGTGLPTTLFALIALVALGLAGWAGWQWYETRERLAEIQLEFSERLSEIDVIGKEQSAPSKQLRDELLALQTRISSYENRLSGLAGQQTVLENLVRDLKQDQNVQLLAEIEQNIMFAARQLQLAGNVRGAISTLQSSDERLMDSERFIVLRKALSRDLERLRALPQIDLPGMSMRLENAVSALDTLPFADDARPSVSAPPAEQNDAGIDAPVASLEFWKNFGAYVLRKARGLVRIQRIDGREAAPPLAPDQRLFLRENCKLRLLSARIALLSSNQALFRRDVEQARNWIERYFNTGEKNVQTVLETLRQFESAEIGVELPSLDESLSSIADLRTGKESK
jgi:uroporphyrin-3 C-methyltransferase